MKRLTVWVLSKYAIPIEEGGCAFDFNARFEEVMRTIKEVKII